MKKVAIVSRRSAEKLRVESLFHPVDVRTLVIDRWTTGKFKHEAFPVGRVVEVSDHVLALFTKPGNDRDGRYVSLYCVIPPREPLANPAPAP
jgi:hypothetical protein